MQDNIILSGVGGQGILSIAAALAFGALSKGLKVKQSEVHGMSQRGGAVQSHIRISDKEIQSVLIPYGTANAIISVEPLEVLKYLPFLSSQGYIISSTDIYDKTIYPNSEKVLEEIRKVTNHILIDAGKLALKAGNKKSANMVVLGAATPFLNIGEDIIREGISQLFSSKGERILQVNIDAFNLGLEFVQNVKNSSQL